jgi:hypothetical protein
MHLLEEVVPFVHRQRFRFFSSSVGSFALQALHNSNQNLKLYSSIIEMNREIVNLN